LSAPIAETLVEALDGILASKNTRHGYTVQDNGTVSIPDIGRVVIGGLTLEEAEDAVYQQLVTVGMASSFSIEITEFNSQKISVSGNVVSPGIQPISMQPLYLDQAIYQRGGIAISDASFVVIRLYRDGSIYQISGPDMYNQNDNNKILLKDGDRIVVDMTNDYDNTLGLRQQAREHILRELEMKTEAKSNQAASILSRIEYGSIPRDYVYLIGEVHQQSRFTLPFENQAFLADALLKSAGGISSLSGNPKQIYVLREASQSKKLEKIVVFHLDARNVANFLLATRLELRPKDVVFIGTQPITNWNRIISQIIPSLGLPNIKTSRY
jgi:polysaccharide export outer membrane protein